jgi:hypothetical protein
LKRISTKKIKQEFFRFTQTIFRFLSIGTGSGPLS